MITKGGRNGKQSKLELQKRSTENRTPPILVGHNIFRFSWRVLFRFGDECVYGVRGSIFVIFMEVLQPDFWIVKRSSEL